MEVVALGIDYGSKTSGFTAMASYCSSGEVQIFQSTKGKDADAWILSLIDELKPQSVAIDAPFLKSRYLKPPLLQLPFVEK